MARIKAKVWLALACGLVLIAGALVLLSIPVVRAAPPAGMGSAEARLSMASARLAALGQETDRESSGQLLLAKTATSNLVRTGSQVTYTLYVTNSGSITLTTTITDLLPSQYTPSGSIVWNTSIPPGRAWTQTLPVTLTVRYTGTLTNRLQATAEEGASGTAEAVVCANACQAHLPLALNAHVTGLPPREWDPRLDELGVYVEPAVFEPGEPHWRLVKARWANQAESAGLHHIFFEVLDEEGDRAAGQSVVVEWREGTLTLLIKPGPPPEWGADFGMYNTLGSYDALVGGDTPSDRVIGMGLGTPEQPDFTIHTSFYLTFRLIP